MSPSHIVAWCVLAAIFAAVVPYLIGKRALARKDRALREAARDLPDRDIYKTVADDLYVRTRGQPPALSGYMDKYGRRVDGRGVRTQSVFLTPRQLTRVNEARSVAGKRPLNRDGFTNAVAHAWDQPKRQPDNSSSWLTYLIMYECLTDDHTSRTVRQDTGLTITPDAPYNGHGGEYGGAGASGDWDHPDASTAAAAAAITVGASLAVGTDGSGRPVDMYNQPVADPLSDPGSYKGSTDYQPQTPSAPEPSYAPNPEPSYSAPDPTPSVSVSADSGSTPSYDSGSASVSVDTGSSSFDGGGSFGS